MKKVLALIASSIFCICLLTVMVSAAPYVAYWGFDGNAVDEINGTAPSDPSALTLSEGKTGQCFGGSADASKLVIFDDINIPVTDNFTFATWFKGTDGAGTYNVMMAKNPKGTDGHFEFYWNPGGGFAIYATNADGQAALIDSTEALNDGQWHHAVVRVENGEWLLYIDGEYDNDCIGSPLVNASGPMFFGSLVDSTLISPNSRFDDLFFTDTLIPEEDIPALMADTKVYAYKLAGKTMPETTATQDTSPETIAVETDEEETVIDAPVTAAQTYDSMIIIIIAAVLTMIISIKIRKAAVK